MVKREVGWDTYQRCSLGLSLGTYDNTFLFFQCLVHYPFGPFGLMARTRTHTRRARTHTHTHTRMSRVSTQALSHVRVAHVAYSWSSTHSSGTTHSYQSPPARVHASRISHDMYRMCCSADCTSCCATCFASTDSAWVYAFTNMCACVICMNSHPCVAEACLGARESKRDRVFCPKTNGEVNTAV